MRFIDKVRKQKQKETPPRQLKELELLHKDAAEKAGQVQYQIEVLKRELDRLNGSLYHLNQEAAKRKDLDFKAAQQKATEEAAKQPETKENK